MKLLLEKNIPGSPSMSLIDTSNTSSIAKSNGSTYAIGMWKLRKFTQKKKYNMRLNLIIKLELWNRWMRVARDLQEILRIGAEQKRLWKAYGGEVNDLKRISGGD